MDELNALRVFARVFEHRNLSLVARDLGLTPSSISRSLSDLERSLGVRLINRTTRRLQVTEAGDLFYQHATRIIEQVDAAHSAVQRLQDAPRGVLRITAPTSFGRMHVVPLVPTFFERYPEVAIDLTLTDAVVDLLESDVDLAIRITSLKDSTLIARRLAPDTRVMCASPAYLQRRGVPHTLADLAHHNCLVYAYQKGPVTWKMRTEGGVEEVEVSGNLRTNSGEALREAALAGLGIALQGTWRVGPDLRAGRLVQLLPGRPVSTSTLDTAIYAVYPHRLFLSPKVRVFVEFLLESYAADDRREDLRLRSC